MTMCVRTGEPPITLEGIESGFVIDQIGIRERFDYMWSDGKGRSGKGKNSPAGDTFDYIRESGVQTLFVTQDVFENFFLPYFEECGIKFSYDTPQEV